MFYGLSRVFFAPNRAKHPAFSPKHVRATKTRRVFAKNASGRPKRGAFLWKIHRDKQNVARFRKQGGGTPNTPSGGVPPAQKQPPPKKVFPAQRDFAETPHGWCFPKTKAATTQKGFLRPDMILPNPRTGAVPPTQKQPPQQPLTAIKD
ncbi:MAG: hypothetical protein K2O09_00565 [Treponemataceae bacterium]|nr:hypothetical protein [Treponemataceae bacterium]